MSATCTDSAARPHARQGCAERAPGTDRSHQFGRALREASVAEHAAATILIDMVALSQHGSREPIGQSRQNWF